MSHSTAARTLPTGRGFLWIQFLDFAALCKHTGGLESRFLPSFLCSSASGMARWTLRSLSFTCTCDSQLRGQEQQLPAVGGGVVRVDHDISKMLVSTTRETKTCSQWRTCLPSYARLCSAVLREPMRSVPRSPHCGQAGTAAGQMEFRRGFTRGWLETLPSGNPADYVRWEQKKWKAKTKTKTTRSAIWPRGY